MAAWPALFSENHGSKRTRLLMNAAMAIAFPLALLQLFAQLVRSLLFASDALLASELLFSMVLVVVKLVLIEHICTEAACTLPARVILKVIWTKSLRTTVLAYQLCSLRAEMMVAFSFRPVLRLICRFAFAASKLRLTLSAYQSYLLFLLHVLQHVVVKLEAAEFFQAVLALVLVVPARRVPSLCTARAHEISVRVSMVFFYRLHVPRARIKDIFASRAPVAVASQALFPDIIALDTTLAY